MLTTPHPTLLPSYIKYPSPSDIRKSLQNTPIRHLNLYIHKEHMRQLTTTILSQYPYVAKLFTIHWFTPPFRNHLWSSLQCTNHTNLPTTIQSIHGPSRNHIIWPTQFPSPLCNVCPLQESDTCLHVLSISTNTTLNNI